MESRTLGHLASTCRGELREAGGVSATSRAVRVITDSRTARPGDVFFALRGDRFDGHDFLEEVQQGGAMAAVIARDQVQRCPQRLAQILVDEPLKALGQFAATYRQAFQLPIVAVAGSNGKTTTKDLVAHLLAGQMMVWKSPASFNNAIGVPLTLLGIERQHEVAVLEVGSNHPGEMAPLLQSISPQLGVLTNLGPEHLEYFGDMEGVAAEEGELAAALPEEGVLFVGGDSPLLDSVIARASCRVVRVGLRQTDAWRVNSVGLDWDGTRFRLGGGAGRYAGDYFVPVPGRHMAVNAALALAVASVLGVDPAVARETLTTFTPPKQRFRWCQIRGVRVIDDTYNANEASMRAALETLTDLPCAGRRVAVLGDMAELGRHAETAHAEVGRICADHVDALFVAGEFASWTEAAAIRHGLSRVAAFPTREALLPALLSYLRSEDVVLLKASRSCCFEGLLDSLCTRLRSHETARGTILNASSSEFGRSTADLAEKGTIPPG